MLHGASRLSGRIGTSMGRRSELTTTARCAKYLGKDIVSQNRKGTSGWRPVSPILQCILQIVKIFFMSFVLLCTV